MILDMDTFSSLDIAGVHIEVNTKAYYWVTSLLIAPCWGQLLANMG